MKLKCEHAPALGGAVVGEEGWRPLIFLATGTFLLHEIS